MAVLLLSACIRHRYPSQLLRADSLFNSKPDSAVLLLRQLKPQMAKASKADRMFYELLRIKAADKTDRPIAHCDSAILHLINYYEQDGDPAKLAETYYYAGRIYYEKQDAPQALDYYLKAMDNIGLTTDSIHLKSVLLSQIGYIYSYQGIIDEALKWYNHAIEYAKANQDTISLIFGLRDAATAFLEKRDYPEAELLLIEAIGLAEQQNDTMLIYSCHSQMASVHIARGNYALAKKHLAPVIKADLSPFRSSVNYMAAKVYEAMGQFDSMKYYGQRVLREGTVYAKESTSKRLADISVMNNEPDSALVYLRQYAMFSDSVKKITNSETVVRVHALFNYNKQEKENVILKERNKRQIATIFATLTLSAILVLSIIILILNSRRKKTLNEARLERLKRNIARQKILSEQFVEQNKRKILELEDKISKLGGRNALLENQLKEERERLKEDNQESELEIQRMKRKSMSIKNYPIYDTIKAKVNATNTYNASLTAEEWGAVDAAINEVFESFGDTLAARFDMSEQEYHVCLLLKLGFSPAAIAKVTLRSQQAITSTRSRLYAKFFGKKGTPAEWDEFIRSI